MTWNEFLVFLGTFLSCGMMIVANLHGGNTPFKVITALLIYILMFANFFVAILFVVKLAMAYR